MKKYWSVWAVILVVVMLLLGGSKMENDFKVRYFFGDSMTDKEYSLMNSTVDLERLTNKDFFPIDDYDEAFFLSHSLIILKISKGSGSNKLRVVDVRKENSEVAIDIEQYSPEIGTCDMSYWLIAIELGKTTDNTPVVVNYIFSNEPFNDLRKIYSTKI
jgi:hypothetical protein